MQNKITLTFCIAILSVFLSKDKINAQAISLDLFGQNAWMPDYIGATFYNGDLANRWQDLEDSRCKSVRIGGCGYDCDAPDFIIASGAPTTAQLVALIQSIQANGQEPIVQIAYADGRTIDKGALTSTQAAALVYAINVSPNQLNVKYWMIGNEPDLYPDNNTALEIQTYIQNYSTAMKDKDVNIKIIGPDLATFGNDDTWSGNILMNALVGGTYSIMGTISSGAGNGKYFIDLISFHYYPQTIGNRADVIANPTAAHDGFKYNLTTTETGRTGLVDMINNNTSRTTANLQIACTEFNLINNTSTEDESDPTDYANMIKNYGYRSLLGGQWMAEVFLRE